MIKDTINDILGGIRSSCTYVGAQKLKELPKRTTFIRVSQQINEIFGSVDEGKSSAFLPVIYVLIYACMYKNIHICKCRCM
jgi:hypothetical protein